jgi:hypothetical protein
MNNVDSIKELDDKLLRIRLEITEKNQEVESLKKSAKI